MTVRELIEKLKREPMENVVLLDWDIYDSEDHDLRSVESSSPDEEHPVTWLSTEENESLTIDAEI